MSNANDTFVDLLKGILREGADVPSRAGKTKELTFINFRVDDPQNRYITVPGRNVSVPAQIAETMWVLAGRNDVEWLSAYLPQAPKFADDGKHWRAGYGPRIRGWFGNTDQLTNIINLLQEDPNTRRAVMSLWSPAADVRDSKDIPCNNWLHFLARDGVLNLNIATRSNDVMWGWSGINFFEWSVLLEIVAAHTNMAVGSLYFNVSSMHLYERHFEKAEKIVSGASNGRPYLRPFETRYAGSGSVQSLDNSIARWFAIEEEIREGKLDSIASMKDPLLNSWLWAIAYFWGHEDAAKTALSGRSIWPALVLSPKRKKSDEEQNLELLVSMMCRLHTEKSAAYGDSWKKRGEKFSILPNIARKVDRILANTETSDENRLDTAMDAVVYLSKYQYWLNSIFGDIDTENAYIRQTVKGQRAQGNLDHAFEELLKCVESNSGRQEALDAVKAIAVNHLLELWEGPEGRTLRNSTRSWNPDA